MIDFLVVRTEERCQRIEVARGDGEFEARQHGGRRVRTDAPPDGLPRQHGRRGGSGDRLDPLALAPRALGEQRRALRLPQLDRATLLGVGLDAACPRRAAPRRAPCARRRGRAARRSRPRSRPPPSPARSRPRARRAAPAPRRARRATRSRPSGRRRRALRSRARALPLRRRDPARAARAPSSAAGACGVDAETEVAQSFVRAAQQALGRSRRRPRAARCDRRRRRPRSSRCAMPSSSTILRDDAIMRRAASVRPRSASSTP